MPASSSCDNTKGERGRVRALTALEEAWNLKLVEVKNMFIGSWCVDLHNKVVLSGG